MNAIDKLKRAEKLLSQSNPDNPNHIHFMDEVKELQKSLDINDESFVVKGKKKKGVK